MPMTAVEIEFDDLQALMTTFVVDQSHGLAVAAP